MIRAMLPRPVITPIVVTRSVKVGPGTSPRPFTMSWYLCIWPQPGFVWRVSGDRFPVPLHVRLRLLVEVAAC